MRLHLFAADAREIAADVQFVKHFNNLMGGAEAVLDRALGGEITNQLDRLEVQAFGSSALIPLRGATAVKSANLLVLGLGALERFTVQNLRTAMIIATDQSLKQGFTTWATPVIGISQHVGLPLDAAYAATLQAIVCGLTDHIARHKCRPPVTEITIFDFSPTKVGLFAKLTPDVLRRAGVAFQALSETLFNLDLEPAAAPAPRPVAQAPDGAAQPSLMADLKERVPSLAADLRVLDDLMKIDVQASLNKIRAITEKVVYHLCKRASVSWGDAEPTLERMIGPLIAARGIPKPVAIHVRTIQINASPGSHYQEEPLSAAHLGIARNALIVLIEWYATLT